MGSFFTNVHLRRTADSSIETIASTLDTLAKKSGMVRCGANATKIDRSIVVRAGAGDWISVYDEATEDQDSSKLDALGKILSAATRSSAVSILVHDSDILQLGLFVDGKKIDQYDSNPGYFGEKLTKKAKERAAGNPEKWKHILAEGATVEALAEAWRQEKLFAENTLSRTAELLGCSIDRMGVGYNYLERDRIAPDALHVFQYALTKRPSHESPADGPPHFMTDIPPEYAAQPTKHQYAVGDELRIGVTCRNGGGAGAGVSIRVWGDAIDKGLVVPTSFELLIGNPLSGAKHSRIEPTFATSDQGKLYMADAIAPIPAGIRGGLAAMASSGDWRTMQQALYNAQVHVNVVGNVSAAGQGRLFAALFPTEVGSNEAHVGIYDIEVDSPLYRPLRAAVGDAFAGGSHVARPLSERNVLIAMVVYGVEQARASHHAAKAFEQLAKVCPRIDRIESAIFHADASRRPKTGSFKAKNLFEDKRWKDIVAAFQNEQQVTLAPPFDMDDDGPRRHGYGLAFGRSILPSDGAKRDPEMPALMLWVRVEEFDESTIAKLRETLGSIMEEAMRDFDGIQAFMTRWGHENGALDSTLYEQAAGIHGQTMMRRSWATRWLRAVGNECLWLGPALCNRLGGEAEMELSRIGSVTKIGEGLRIKLACGDNDSVARLEKQVETLLPSATDARDASLRD